MHTLAAIENIFFVVLIAVVGLVRWIAQVAENKRNATAAKRANPPTNAPAPRAPVLSEEERVRKFMEALGVPTSAAPSPKPAPTPPAPVTPKNSGKVRPIDPFPRPSIGEWKPVFAPTPVFVPPPVFVPEKPPVAESPALPPPAITPSLRLSTEFEVDSRAKAQSWARRLASSESLRDAIVLREIFGPPRCLQV